MKKLDVSLTTSDDSEGFRCPDCLHWFRVNGEFPNGSFYTECPSCGNEYLSLDAVSDMYHHVD